MIFDRRAVLALPAIGILLASCALGPDFVPPKPPDVTGYSREQLPERTGASTIPGGEAQRFAGGVDIGGQWWTLFRRRPSMRSLPARWRPIPASK